MKKWKNILMCKCHVTITKQGASKTKTLWCRKSYKSTVFLQVQHSQSNKLCIFREVPSIASLNFAKQQQDLEKIKNIEGYTESNRKREWVLEAMWFNTEHQYRKNMESKVKAVLWALVINSFPDNHRSLCICCGTVTDCDALSLVLSIDNHRSALGSKKG